MKGAVVSAGRPGSDDDHERRAPNGTSGPPGPGLDPAPGDRIGDFEVLRPVARGGMASVLAVRDTRDGKVRAMKLLLPFTQGEDARSRFRREFRALSRLNHPNVIQVYEWGLLGERPWFTMELLEGQILRDAVEPWKDIEPADRFAKAEHVLREIARALAYIHGRGLVHRDVTPSNVMLLPDGRIKLMDFGVVKETLADFTVMGEVLGTVAWIAPEQVHGGAIDARADLYALGAVLYLMLTGRRPFTAPTLQGYLDKHLHQAPKPPAEVEPLVPEHLERICLRLLEKAPGDRYASAAHLLHVLGDTTDLDEVGGRFPPQAVGRTWQRATLREAMDDVASTRTGRAIVLSGGPGMGKTRLLDLAEAHARRIGLPVARGLCRPHDRPFGAFVSVYRMLGSDGAAPILEAVLGTGDDETVRERYPVIAAFRELVVARAPCVIMLDDLERADPATVELLDYLVRNTLELAQVPVVYLLGVESAEPPTLVERHLAESPVVRTLPIGPLTRSDTEELLLGLVPDSPAARALAERLFTESAGSPELTAEVLRAMVDQGVLVADGPRFRISLDASVIDDASLPVPASFRDALRDRLAGLSAPAREVATVLAVGRRRLDLDLLVQATGLDEDDVIDAVDTLIDAGLVDERRRDDAELFDLAEPRHRDVLHSALSEEERRVRHLRLGTLIEARHRDRIGGVVQELAWHFEAAGVADKAYTYLVQTANRHLQRSLFDECLGFLDRALVLEPEARRQVEPREADRRLAELHLARAQAHYNLGDWGRALTDARAAERLVDGPERATDEDPALASRIQAELGNVLRNRGEFDPAEAALRRALELAEAAGDPHLEPMPRYHLGALQWARGDLDQAERDWREVLRTAQQIGDDRALGYGYNGLGILALCRGRSPEARSHWEQSTAIFEELGMLGPLSIARVNLVELYLSTGLIRKALALADRTIAQAREVHHRHGMALGLAYRSQVLLELGRAAEALQNAREALRIIRSLGTNEDEVTALFVLARADVLTGRDDRALVRFDELTPLLGAHDAEGIAPQVTAFRAAALAGVGRLAEGRAVLEAMETARQWPQVQVRTDLAVGRAWRLLGAPDRAEPVLTTALQTAEANGYRYHQLVAHDELARVAAEPATRARHARVAQSLARSLAANLHADHAGTFLDRKWGGAR